MDRIAAARERLDAVKSVALAARVAGPPCQECRFRTLRGSCGNPAYAVPSFDVASGRYAERFDTPVATARADDGLCGAEALLFEPLQLPIAAANGAWRGAKTAWLTIAGALFAANVIGMMFFY